jgi:prepilin-type N-terminal cleavage/methylation domain-containing protein
MRRSQAGFTLLELMVVVTVMGTMAAMLAPGIGEFMADARCAGAAEDLVRISRHVRARSQESGLAHLVEMRAGTADSGGLGVLRVWEGMNNRCRLTPWLQTVNGSVNSGHGWVEELDLGSSHYNQPPGGGRAPTIDDGDRQVISMRAGGSITTPEYAAICIEPSGATWQGVSTTASGTGYAFTRQTQAATFTFTRSVNGVTRGALRTIVFQPGGIARFRF